MPDALKLPGVRCTVIPLMRADDSLIGELIANRLPRLASIVRALDHLAKPAGGGRGIQPVRVSRRTFEVVDLPDRNEGAVDVASLALAVGCENERALMRPQQYSYSTHRVLLLRIT